MVVVHDVAEVVAAAVVRFSDGHGVVGKVDIAVIAEVLRHRRDGGELVGRRFE